MSSDRRDPSPSPSVSSMMLDVLSELSPEEQSLRTLLRNRLSKRIFLGHYQERRFVEPLTVYRDMVVLHSSEEELKLDIDFVKCKLLKFYGIDKWIGITRKSKDNLKCTSKLRGKYRFQGTVELMNPSFKFGDFLNRDLKYYSDDQNENQRGNAETIPKRLEGPDTIGAPSAGYCLWVKLQDVPFGFYWFQIRRIRYNDNEITLQLKVIRSVRDEIIYPSSSSLNIKKTLSDNVDALASRLRTGIHALSKSQSNVTDDSAEPQKCSEHKSQSSTKSTPKRTESESITSENHQNHFSEPDSTTDKTEKSTKSEKLKIEDLLLLVQIIAQNWKDILKFLFAMIVGFAQGTGKFVHYVGEFSLKFMHEVSHFCRAITPIVLAVIELVGKVIGGFYILIAMLVGRGPSPPPMRQIMPPPNRFRNDFRH